MELHPDEVVAVGAAMQGAVLQAKSGEGSHAVREQYAIVEIRDVLSHSMGVIALDEAEREVNSIILSKDTEAPCEASDVYNTVANNQRKVHVRVTQGEDEDPAYVQLLAEAVLDIPPYPKGAPLQVTFRFDEDQVLHVSVRDLTANKDLGEIPVPRIANLTEDQVDQLSAKLSRVAVS